MKIILLLLFLCSFNHLSGMEEENINFYKNINIMIKHYTAEREARQNAPAQSIINNHSNTLPATLTPLSVPEAPIHTLVEINQRNASIDPFENSSSFSVPNTSRINDNNQLSIEKDSKKSTTTKTQWFNINNNKGRIVALLISASILADALYAWQHIPPEQWNKQGTIKEKIFLLLRYSPTIQGIRKIVSTINNSIKH